MKKSKLAIIRAVFVSIIGFSIVFPSLGLAVCSDGITAYWKLDENDGLGVYVDAIGPNNGTGNAAPTAAPLDGIDGAQLFDGSTATGIDVPASSTFNWLRTDSFSIAFWVKPAVDSGLQVIMGRIEASPSLFNWWIGLQNGKVAFYFRDELGAFVSVIGQGPDLPVAKWHHVAVVRDGTTNNFILYINGQLIDLSAVDTIRIFNNGLISLTAPLSIGYFINPGQPNKYRFDGLLDEIAIYNRALPLTEIEDHFEAGQAGVDYCDGAVTLAPFPDGITAYWKLDENDGLGVYVDAIGPNNGTGNAAPTAAPLDGIDGAQLFDGSTATGIDVPASSTFNWLRTDSFSIAFWVKPAVDSGLQVIMGRIEASPSLFNWWIGLQNGKVAFYFRDELGAFVSVIGQGPDLPVAKWHHVAVVRDGTTNNFILYINGQLIDLSAVDTIRIFNNGLISLTAPLSIGYFINPGQPNKYRFDGLLDEIAIYNRALPLTEIEDHFEAGILGKSVLSLKPDPVANAGPDQTVTGGENVTLAGSDSTGTDLGFLWEQVGTDPQVNLEAADTATATFTAPPVDAAGASLTFRLTVTDNDGRRDSDTVIVQVVEAVMPVADAGSDQTVSAGDSVTLDGSGSTGSGLTFLWVQIGDPAVTLAGATSDTATFTAPTVDAALTFRLTVTDDKGQASSDTVQVTVSAGSTPPPPPPTSSGGGGGGCFINTML